jgi:hypothetical protein
MALIPRWRFMNDEAKALAKRTAVSLLVVLLAFTMVVLMQVPVLVLAIHSLLCFPWLSK